MTELEHSVRRHIGRDGRRIDARGFGVQIVDANACLVEFAFAFDPIVHHAQVIEPPRQPILSAIAWQDLLVQTATERLLMRCDPRLNVREPVVALRKNEGQPNAQHLPQTQARPMTMGREVFV